MYICTCLHAYLPTTSGNQIPGWVWKTKQKVVLFLFKVISTYLNTFVELFKKFLKTVRKGLQMNSIQFGHHVFLNVLSILKRLSFEGSFHLRKEKNLITKMGLFWQVWMKSFMMWVSVASVSLYGMDFVQNLLLPSIFMGDLMNCLLIDVWLNHYHSESQSTILCHISSTYPNCVCILRRCRTSGSWIILKILMPVFRSFKPFIHTSTS